MSTKDEKQQEHWMTTKWRPMMGWLYMLVCFMDFIGFPVLWSLLQAHDHGTVTSQWQPLTLQGGGLFHMAMGAIIGISAYGRTQEKLGGATSTPTTVGFGPGAGTTYQPPASTAAQPVSNPYSPPPTQSYAAQPVANTYTPPAPAPYVAPTSAATVVDPDTQPHPDPTVDPDRPVRRIK